MKYWFIGHPSQVFVLVSRIKSVETDLGQASFFFFQNSFDFVSLEVKGNSHEIAPESNLAYTVVAVGRIKVV